MCSDRRGGSGKREEGKMGEGRLSVLTGEGEVGRGKWER